MAEPHALPLLVINRAVDRERLAGFTETAAACGATPIRIAALDAHRPDFPSALFADLIGPTFWGKPDAKPGALGCFLSHRRAWQYIADHGLPGAVIAEDDARLMGGLDRLAALIANTGADEPGQDSAADRVDLIFANARMAGWADLSGGGGALVPLDRVIATLAAAGGPKAHGLTQAPGADCYWLSRTGATRLLALTGQQRIQCGVDWAMIWNGLAQLPPGATESFPELGVLGALLRPVSRPLTAAVLRAPLAVQAPGPSTLRHAVTRPLADLIDTAPVLAHADYVSQIRFGSASLCFAGRSGPDPVMEEHRFGRLWDQAGLKMLLARFPESGTFVDIGAHLGNHAVALARLGRAGMVIAAEPNQEITHLLRVNLAMNQIGGRILLAEAAVGSTDGQAWLIRNRKRSSESMVKRTLPPAQQAAAEPVRMITGDSLIAGRPVDAIKIDTGGSEVDVVRGLSKTLADQAPLILIDHGDGARERVVKVAGQVGYRPVDTVAAGRRKRETTLLVKDL